MPRIRRIQIKNFRSIKNLDVEVEDLATFVGDNDSGKSNILRALNLFFNDKVEPNEPLDFERDYNKFAATNQRARQIDVTITFELPENYHNKNGERAIWKKSWRADGLQKLKDWTGLRRSETRQGRLNWRREEFPSRSKVPPLLSRVEFEYIPAIRGSDFFRNLRGRIYRVISEVSEQSFRDSSSNFEDAIGKNVALLISDISQEIQDTTLLKLPNDLSQIFETLDFLSGDKRISLDQRGDGIKGRYVPLILKFIADKKSSLLERGGTPYTFIWAYEEPENNLEMRRAQETAELFRRLAARNTSQILLTTHSPIFFNITGSDELPVSTLFVSKQTNENGSVAQKTTPTARDLDERMGVMPIVAPHVAKAMLRLKEVDKERTELQQTIEDLEIINPTIYVEGQSDFIVLSALLQALGPNAETPITIQQPPRRAGTDYVANMLRAWEYKTKHLDSDRNSAIGFVDCDDSGDRVFDKFSDKSNKLNRRKHVKLLKFPKSQLVSEAYALGLQFSNCLEEQFPRAWWEYARGQGWLEKRDRDDILSHAALLKIANKEASRDDFIVGKDWELHATFYTPKEHKIDFANWVAARDGEELVNGLSTLSAVLRRECERMRVQF